MKHPLAKVLFWGPISFLLFVQHVCANPHTNSAITLLEPASARSAALGEAFSSLSDDVGSFHYNPATLNSLKQGQASVMYKKGLSEDSFGQFLIGIPRKNYSWGLSSAFYDAGKVDVFDGKTNKTVTAQRDFSLGLGYSLKMGNTNFGVKGQLFQSELAETQSARSFMMDFGIQSAINSRVNVGFSLQHLGSDLTYGTRNESLPKMARLGFTTLLAANRFSPTLLIEAPYDLNNQSLSPSLGFESFVGPLALRTGYRTGRELTEFTVGMGFGWGLASLDYAFGLVNQLESTHLISVSTRFNSFGKKEELVNKNSSFDRITMNSRPVEVHEIKPLQGVYSTPLVYEIKDGDTLKSIATKRYGFSNYWKQIYMANKHLIADPENLKPGQKILLPNEGWK